MTEQSSMVVDSATAAELRAEDRCDGSLPWRTYERWMNDLRNQPAWRQLADKCADYYDGNQLTADQLDELESTGMAPVIANIIRPTIDVVLGMEAKTRQDWRVSADTGEFQDTAEVLSSKLAEAEREAMADRACSDSYAGQIKAGLGWVEVGRNMDPFGYQYRCQYVHRREIDWDWRAKQPDLSDARFLRRRRWIDLDELIAFFPGKRDILEQVGSGRIAFDRFDVASERMSEAYLDAHQRELRTMIDDLEWRDNERGMLCLGELWYRTWHRGHIIKIGGKAIPVDTSKPEVAAAIYHNKVKVQQAVYPKMRLSWWVGPHQLADIPVNRRHFPYIPFWGFREDRTGIPYGLIRPMLDPQDEYNARRSKLMWLLSAKRVFVDSDALDENYNDMRSLANEVNRPDAVVVMNPQRSPNSTVRVDTDHGLASQQFTVMSDAAELLQKTAGVYQSMMGQGGAATSGLAINSLVEQGATTLAEINDNYRFARRLVGQQLVDLIVEDIGGEEQEHIVGDGKKARTVILNQRQPDGSILNDVMRANTKVALADVPSTPSYRAQQLQMLGELTKSLPPNVQGMIIDFVIEATDLSNRSDIAERIRNGLNITDPDDMTPEQKAQADDMLRQQEDERRKAIQIEMRKALAEIADKEASADKKQAEAFKVEQEAMRSATEAGQGMTLETLSQHVAQLTSVVQALAQRRQ